LLVSLVCFIGACPRKMEGIRGNLVLRKGIPGEDNWWKATWIVS